MVERMWQTGLFVVFATLAISAWSFLEPDPIWQVWILVPAVALLGLPHGAFDLPIAQKIWPLDGLTGLLRFSAAYLGLTACVIGVWWLVPGVALALFLTYSAVHFSSDWAEQHFSWRLGGGLSSIGAPALTNPEAVTSIFAQLSSVDAAMTITPLLAAGGVIGLISIALATLIRPNLGPVVELAFLWLAAFALPPLIYFVVYFCGLHSPRHLASVLSGLRCQTHALRQAAGITAVTLVGATLAATTLTSQSAIDEALVKTVFIGLAALTVPHMLLVEHWSRWQHTR